MGRRRGIVQTLGCFLAAWLCCVWLTSSAVLAASQPQQPVKLKLFGTMEFKGKITKLPQWMNVLRSMKTWKGYFKGAGESALPANSGWKKLKAEAASMAPLEKLKAVNRFFNQWPYRLDKANYGVREYWASPKEFIKKSGDCEDYAIAKFYALKELGFSGDVMRIVALKDMIRNIGHAVLAVAVDDKVYVLDNTTPLVLPDTRFKHYLPQYSVNEEFRWMHVPATGKRVFGKAGSKKK